MDISLGTSNDVKIEISKEAPIISVGGERSVSFDVSKQEINISPKKSRAPAFEFVQRVLAGERIVRCTFDQFNAFTSLDGRTLYAVTTKQDELRYLYLGSTLIAKASDDGGTWGFAYSFPMIFGR